MRWADADELHKHYNNLGHIQPRFTPGLLFGQAIEYFVATYSSFMKSAKSSDKSSACSASSIAVMS